MATTPLAPHRPGASGRARFHPRPFSPERVGHGGTRRSQGSWAARPFHSWLLAASLFASSLLAVAEESGPQATQRTAALEALGAKAAAAAAAGTTTVVGRDGWLFFGPELRHLVAGRFWGEDAARASRATKPEHADPLPAILDFKAQLDKAGIDLVIVPVPPKAVVYSEFILEGVCASSRLDPHHEAFYALLREQGIRVLDLTPDFLRQKKSAQLYCRQDTHWSGQACVLTAELLAKEIQGSDWYRSVPKQAFVHETKPVEITGDLARESKGKESVPLRFVGVKSGAALLPIAPDSSSPVILLGDSHNLIFHAGEDMQACGAGLADQLALELGFAVDLVAVRGSGATPARVNLLRRANRKEYLTSKKLVIWCFSAREFTESSGWQKVPVIK